MPTFCGLQLDQANGSYFSGETISGRVILTTNSDKPINGIYVGFCGAAKVSFTYGAGANSTYNYHGEEVYLDNKTMIYHAGTLLAGTHKFTFNIPLPPECPSSCKEKYGKVIYELTLIVDRKNRFNKVFKRPVNVIGQLNLNSSAKFTVPLQITDKVHYCVPFASSLGTLKLFVPCSGYVPGQELKYGLHIESRKKSFNSLSYQVKLKQIRTFHARKPEKRKNTQKRTIAMCEGSAGNLHSKDTVVNGSILIPPVPPTTLGDYIIVVQYLLKMKVNAGFGVAKVKLALPIVLGTVPLLPSFEEATTTKTAGSAGLRLLRRDDPPAYEDCVTPSTTQAVYMGQDYANNLPAFSRIHKPSIYNHFSANEIDVTTPMVDVSDAAERANVAGSGSSFGSDNYFSGGGISHTGGGELVCGVGALDSSGGGCDSGGGGAGDSGGGGGGDSGGGGGADSGGGGGGSCD